MNSHITLSREALANNLNFIRSLMKTGVRLSSVVKGNAYGHGVQYMIPELEALGIDHFAVFSSDEARDVYETCNRNSQIMIMGHLAEQDIDWVLKKGIECYAFNFDRLLRLAQRAEDLGLVANIHIEVETGMNRTGFEEKDWRNVLDLLVERPHALKLVGVCTHFAGAESIGNYKRIQQQRRNFKRFNRLMGKYGLEPQYRHTSCSAGLVTYPKEQWNMIRVGILQYGLWPSRETYISYLTRKRLHADPLKRVIGWFSQVMDLKWVNKDQFVGYGITLLAEEDMRVAAVPVGYCHGYSRSLSNKGKVIIRNRRLDVIGIVNMNMFLVDVTSLEEVAIGDRVILIGDDNGLSITVSSFGELSYQLNYELLTRLDKDIPREVI